MEKPGANITLYSASGEGEIVDYEYRVACLKEELAAVRHERDNYMDECNQLRIAANALAAAIKLVKTHGYPDDDLTEGCVETALTIWRVCNE